MRSTSKRLHFAFAHRVERGTIVIIADQQLTVRVRPIRQRLQIRDLEQDVVARNTLAGRDANVADDATALRKHADHAAVRLEKTVDGFFARVMTARDEGTEGDDDGRQQQRHSGGRQVVRHPWRAQTGSGMKRNRGVAKQRHLRAFAIRWLHRRGNSMSRGERSIAKYFSAVAALNCVAPLDPALRGRLLLARGLARMLLPANAGQLRYAFEELLGETAASARWLLYDWFFYRHLESRSWTHVGADGGRGSFADAEDVGAYLAACPRGIVVATIHLGDYLEGLRQLRVVAAAGKPVFVVRRSEWSEREERAFARIAAGDSL